MEAAKNLLSSPSLFPSRTQPKHFPSSSSSAPVLTSKLNTFLAQHFPASVLIQEQRDESKPLLHIMKEDRGSQATTDGKRMETGFAAVEDIDIVDSDQSKELQCQLLHYLSSPMQCASSKRKKLMGVELFDVVTLAKKALSASKLAVSLVEDYKPYGDNLDEYLTPSSESTSSADIPVDERTVRSTRLSERQSKRRGVSKQKLIVQRTSSSPRPDSQRGKGKAFDPNDPLCLFLWVPETKQLLSSKEESELIAHIQDLMRSEEVKGRLHTQFGREPTLAEWAEVVGLSYWALQSQIHYGNSSRERLIYCNFRMVVHIAKKYQGRGLSLQDLLQEGIKGLMKSVQKFKPQAGCRFATYAYWWIRQSVRKAIFQHSRTIRLPDNVYGLLFKVIEAKRLCIQEGHHNPTKEGIATCAGISVEKLERLLFSARMPLSMQQPVWVDTNTTFQQITADTAIETPNASVAKQLIRQHIRSLLNILSPKEKKIMKLRYGIEGGGKQKSLSEIGVVFGLSKERVRQLESRALSKLKQCLGTQGLGAYSDLLI